MESHKPFQYQLFLLKLIGYQHHYVNNWRGFLLQCWGYCIWVCLGIGAVTGCHCFINNLGNITIFTEALAYTVNWTMCFIRVSVFFTQKKRIMKLVEDLIDVTETVYNVDPKIVRKTNSFSYKMSQMDVIVLTISMSNLILKSISEMLTKQERFLPFKISFFFDLKQPFVFEIFFLVCIILAISIVFATLGPVTTIFAVANNLVAQMKYLQDHYRSLQLTDSIERQQADLKRCIRFHKQIIHWVYELNDIYSPISNAMSVYYAILICTTGFQIVITRDPIKAIAQFCYCVAAVFTLFLYMKAGDEIKYESGNLALSIYESKWYNNPISINRDLIFIIHRTQKDLGIKAAFFEISLDTFANIMKAAGSYITMLMSFLE